MNKFLFTGLLFAFTLTACVSEHYPEPPPPSDPATMKLSEAALSVNDSLEDLSAIRKSQVPYYLKHLPSLNIPGMQYLASVDWTGPIQPLVARIAGATNYRLRVLGNPPAIPIIIQLREKNRTLGFILRNADFQAGRKADIFVYPNIRIIELRYNRIS